MSNDLDDLVLDRASFAFGDITRRLPGWSVYTPTVTLVGGAGNTVPVYSTNSGRFQRVGNFCEVDIYLTGDGGAEGAGTGNLSIALPLVSSMSLLPSSVPIGLITNGADTFIVTGSITAGTAVINLQYQSAVGTISVTTGAEQNNTTRGIKLSFRFEV